MSLVLPGGLQVLVQSFKKRFCEAVFRVHSPMINAQSVHRSLSSGSFTAFEFERNYYCTAGSSRAVWHAHTEPLPAICRRCFNATVKRPASDHFKALRGRPAGALTGYHEVAVKLLDQSIRVTPRGGTDR